MTAFYDEVCGEIVLVKPTGIIEFWKNDQKVSTLTLIDEKTAIDYARAKNWREMVS